MHTLPVRSCWFFRTAATIGRILRLFQSETFCSAHQPRVNSPFLPGVPATFASRSSMTTQAASCSIDPESRRSVSSGRRWSCSLLRDSCESSSTGTPVSSENALIAATARETRTLSFSRHAPSASDCTSWM